MKLLGRGWQYSTYDLGNGRVLKKYNSVPIGYVHMFMECFPFNHDPIWDLPKFYKGCKETAHDSIKKIQSTEVERWMMGNPKVLNSLDYEQDKLKPLHKYLLGVDIKEGKKIVDEFIVFNKVLVERKLIDKSFNIANNFGLDSHGRVVLMDLGELYSSDAAIKDQIQKRAWSAYYVTNVLPVYLREYFVSSMDWAFKVV